MYDDIKDYNVKFVECNNRLEVYRYDAPIIIGKTNNKNGRKGIHDMEYRKIEKNRKETLNKARNEIIRLSQCNPDLSTFITLTYAENMKDIRQSKIDLCKCLRMMQRFFPSFKYLYVLEYQQRGAIHYHMLCNMPVPVETAKSKQLKPEEQKEFEQFFEETFWTHGFVDIRDLKKEGNTNVGLYVSVYLVEDLFKIDLKGNRCYGYSRNLNKPVVTKKHIGYLNQDIIVESHENYDMHYIASYKIQFKSGLKSFTNTVTYFDMYRKE